MPTRNGGGSRPPRVRLEVNPSDAGWRVERQGAKRADSIHENKVDAVERAAELGRALQAAGQNAQVIIKKLDGTFQSERTYGADPRRTPG